GRGSRALPPFPTRRSSDLDVYEQRTDAYVAQLNGLDEAFMETVQSSPRQDIVFGGRFAYSYFIHRYGLTYETVYHTCSAESDPRDRKSTRLNSSHVSISYA